LAEEKSFNKTSDKLGIDFNKVKYQIEKLEEEFNSTFFIRSPRGCKLTKDGIRFYEYSTKLEADYYKMLRSFTKIRKLKVGVDMGFPPSELIKVTQQVCNEKEIETKFVDYDPDYLLLALENGEIDLIFNYEFQVPKTIQCKEVMLDHMVVVIGKQSPLFPKEKIGLDDMRDVSIYFKHYDIRGSKKMVDILNKHSKDFDVQFGVSIDEVKKQLDNGKGIMIVPYCFYRKYMNKYEYREIDQTISIHYCVYSFYESVFQDEVVNEIYMRFQKHARS
jgi:DNA-binding transcriptional LysR family regulator